MNDLQTSQKSKHFQGLMRSLSALSMGIFLVFPLSPASAQSQKMPAVTLYKPATSTNGGTTVSMATSGVTLTLSLTPPTQEKSPKKILTMWITAYSSSPDETDDTPFITASGKTVRDGIVATNLFPFGTHIMIPSLFGDKVFVVQDRMHRRKKNNIDIWMPSKREALRFGINYADVLILENPYDQLIASEVLRKT